MFNDALFDSIARHQLGQPTNNQGNVQEEKVKAWESKKDKDSYVCV